MCLLLLFPQPSGGSLGDHHPSGVSCPHLPRAPGVWGVAPGPTQAGLLPEDSLLVQDAEGRNQPPSVLDPALSLAGKGKAA